MDTEKLIHRLSRAQGQVEAIKKILKTEEEHNCLDVLRLHKAAIQALKKSAEAYVQHYAQVCMSKKDAKEMSVMLQEAIASAFTL